jgi:hypothetical protein
MKKTIKYDMEMAIGVGDKDSYKHYNTSAMAWYNLITMQLSARWITLICEHIRNNDSDTIPILFTPIAPSLVPLKMVEGQTNAITLRSSEYAQAPFNQDGYEWICLPWTMFAFPYVFYYDTRKCAEMDEKNEIGRVKGIMGYVREFVKTLGYRLDVRIHHSRERIGQDTLDAMEESIRNFPQSAFYDLDRFNIHNFNVSVDKKDNIAGIILYTLRRS